MTSQAVEEKPATQTTSEADTTQASEGDLSQREPTAQSDSVQQNSDPDSSQQQGDNTAPPDPRETRVQALADAERAEAEQRGRDAALAELQGNTEAQNREQARLRVRNTYQNTLAEVDQVFAAATDEYGTPRPLTPAENGRVKALINNYHKVATDVAEDTIATTVRDTAYALLPKPAQDAFTAAISGETDLPTYLNLWAETAALHTKAVKSMTLEDAVKSSSKIKREVEAAKLAAYDEGRDQGRLDPPGTSPDGGKTATRSAPGQKSYIQLEEGYGKGELTKAEEMQYTQMRDARKKG